MTTLTLSELKARAARLGYDVLAWSPGDGATRYKIAPAGRYNAYHSVRDSDAARALGRRELAAVLDGVALAATRGQTPGQIAYERDVRARPLYDDGAKRKRWEDLDDVARASWERNPTSRFGAGS